MRRAAARIAVLLLGAAVTAASPRAASALRFQYVTDVNGQRVLFLRDCGAGSLDSLSDCRGYETQVAGPGCWAMVDGEATRGRCRGAAPYPGDAAMLESVLGRSHPLPAEVWLYSGGGDADQGILIGRVLRKYGMKVRVPNAANIRRALGSPKALEDEEAHCVSACTVAFMGGALRYMDDGATYEVHSSSAFLGASGDDLAHLDDWRELAAQVDTIERRARYNVRRRLRYFQNTLRLGTRYPQISEDDDQLQYELRSERAASSYTEDDARRDAARIAREGAAAAQDIMMRIERESTRAAIADLRTNVQRYGPRADAALRIIDEMHDTSIKETQILTRETMLRLGFLTKDVDFQVRP